MGSGVEGASCAPHENTEFYRSIKGLELNVKELSDFLNAEETGQSFRGQFEVCLAHHL